jgi:hypothetical protein
VSEAPMTKPKFSIDVQALLRELRAAEEKLEQKWNEAADEAKGKIEEELKILKDFRKKINGNISPS